MIFKREPRRKLAGSRFRLSAFVTASVLTGALLAACVNHYQPSFLPLPVSEGWVQLPTARWLTDPGIEPGTVMFCPREPCGQQVLVARMDLTGKERWVAGLVARDPAGFVARSLSAQQPRISGTRPSRASRSTVTPLTIGAWRGAVVRLESVKDRARAAHVVVLAMSDGPQAHLVMTVAESAEDAEQQARRVLQ